MISADGSEPGHRGSSRRIYVMWGVGLAFLLALGLFCLMVLKPVLTDPSADVRCNAGVALVNIVQDATALETMLKPVLEDADRQVREAVSKALQERKAHSR